MKTGWKKTKLKRVTQLLYGDSLSNENRIQGDVPVYGSNGIVGFHDQPLTKAPCIIIGRKGSFGKINYSKKECFPIDTTFFINQDATKHNIRWLYYSLLTLNLDSVSKDSAVPGLSREEAYEKYIDLPPVIEQIKIAEFLDHKTKQIDTLIQKKEKLIELLKEQRTAIINQAVTKGLDPNVPMKDSGIEWLGEIPKHWTMKKLKFLCRIQTGGKDTENKEENGEYPFFVRSQTVERISTYSFDGEAILTAGDGVGVGKVFHYIKGKFDYHQRVYMLYNFKNILGKYLFYYIRENLYKEVIKISAKSTVDSLRLPMFQNFIVVYGTQSEQEKIIDYIEQKMKKIDASIDNENKGIDLLKEYRTSLISAAITGKIDVREEVVHES